MLNCKIRFLKDSPVANAGDYVEFKARNPNLKFVLAEESMFMKQDLKAGMVAQYRCGDDRMVMPEELGNLVLVDSDGYSVSKLEYYTEDLIRTSGDDAFDIVTVYGYRTGNPKLSVSSIGRPILWERKEKPVVKLWNGKTYEQNHRDLWNWLADNPDKEKKDWFSLHPGEEVFGDCFACQVAKGFLGCKKCPICTLGTHNGPCLNGLFNKYHSAKGYERATFAKKIAELPWKEER